MGSWLLTSTDRDQYRFSLGTQYSRLNTVPRPVHSYNWVPLLNSQLGRNRFVVMSLDFWHLLMTVRPGNQGPLPIS